VPFSVVTWEVERASQEWTKLHSQYESQTQAKTPSHTHSHAQTYFTKRGTFYVRYEVKKSHSTYYAQHGVAIHKES